MSDTTQAEAGFVEPIDNGWDPSIRSHQSVVSILTDILAVFAATTMALKALPDPNIWLFLALIVGFWWANVGLLRGLTGKSVGNFAGGLRYVQWDGTKPLGVRDSTLVWLALLSTAFVGDYVGFIATYAEERVRVINTRSTR